MSFSKKFCAKSPFKTGLSKHGVKRDQEDKSNTTAPVEHNPRFHGLSHEQIQNILEKERSKNSTPLSNDG